MMLPPMHKVPHAVMHSCANMHLKGEIDNSGNVVTRFAAR
eukprot:SAG31_NODE_482_length_15056_cov_5.057364_1_plen_39_part_10